MKLVERAQDQSALMLKEKPIIKNRQLKLRLNNISADNDDRNLFDNSPCDTVAPVRHRLNNIRTNRTNSVTDHSFSTAPSGHLLNSNLTFMNSLQVNNRI